MVPPHGKKKGTIGDPEPQFNEIMLQFDTITITITIMIMSSWISQGTRNRNF